MVIPATVSPFISVTIFKKAVLNLGSQGKSGVMHPRKDLSVSNKTEQIALRASQGMSRVKASMHTFAIRCRSVNTSVNATAEAGVTPAFAKELETDGADTLSAAERDESITMASVQDVHQGKTG